MAKKATEKLNKEIKEKVLKFGKVLKQDGVPVKKLVVFGSYAKNTASQKSDIDVCVVSPVFGKDTVEDLKFLLEERRKVDNRIEPHGFSPKGYSELENPLIWEIRKHGLEIKAS